MLDYIFASRKSNSVWHQTVTRREQEQPQKSKATDLSSLIPRKHCGLPSRCGLDCAEDDGQATRDAGRDDDLVRPSPDLSVRGKG